MSTSGIVDNGLSKPDALTIALRKFAKKLVFHVRHRAALQHIIDALGQFLPPQTLDLPHKLEVFSGAHFGIERRDFRQIPDAALDLQGFLQHVEARDCGGARRRRKKTRQHAHGRGLACAIWAEKADDLPFLNLKGDVVNSRVAGVPFREFLNSNHKILTFGRGKNASLAAANLEFL